MTAESGNGWASLVQALKDLRISPRISLSAALVGSVFAWLTWAPDWLGIRTAIQSWRPWLLLVAVAGTVTFVVDLSAVALEHARASRRKRERDAHYDRTAAEKAQAAREQTQSDLAEKIKFLEQMTLGERQICQSFVVKGIRTQNLRADSAVLELARRDVLIRVSPSTLDEIQSYSMSDWAWEHLRVHKDLLDGANRNPIQSQ